LGFSLDDDDNSVDELVNINADMFYVALKRNGVASTQRASGQSFATFNPVPSDAKSMAPLSWDALCTALAAVPSLVREALHASEIPAQGFKVRYFCVGMRWTLQPWSPRCMISMALDSLLARATSVHQIDVVLVHNPASTGTIDLFAVDESSRAPTRFRGVGVRKQTYPLVEGHGSVQITLSNGYLEGGMRDADVELLKGMELQGVLRYLATKIENEEDDGVIFEELLQGVYLVAGMKKVRGQSRLNSLDRPLTLRLLCCTNTAQPCANLTQPCHRSVGASISGEDLL